jgi:hypothetical protein
MIQDFLRQGLHNRSGLIRKGSALLLRAPKRLAKRRTVAADYVAYPPILVNSIPKCGTHLLDQIVGSIPAARNFGEFLSSMTSSFRFQRRPTECLCRILEGSIPGELVRSHLFYSQDVADSIRRMGFVHFFIFRDPRDVVVSEALYYRRINRWHRLHPLFRDADSDAAAILLAINGLADHSDQYYFPDIGARVEHYRPWTTQPGVLSVRFEDLVSEHRDERIREMMSFYAGAAPGGADVDDLCRRALAAIDPKKSHTYRSGKSGGWRKAFTDEHRQAFKRVAGRQLIALNYETNDDW